jgi:hypothetical protein
VMISVVDGILWLCKGKGDRRRKLLQVLEKFYHEDRNGVPASRKGVQFITVK